MAIQQQLLPLLSNIQTRAGSGRALLQDDASPVTTTLEDYYALVDDAIRPTLEALGTDNATIVQLVNSTASFLFSLEKFPGDVNFATRAAQVRLGSIVVAEVTRRISTRLLAMCAYVCLLCINAGRVAQLMWMLSACHKRAATAGQQLHAPSTCSIRPCGICALQALLQAGVSSCICLQKAAIAD
jgi:hypothetical protein